QVRRRGLDAGQRPTREGGEGAAIVGDGQVIVGGGAEDRQGIGPGPAIDRIGAIAERVPDDIVAGSTADRVIAEPACDGIVTGITADAVVATKTIQAVVSTDTHQ